LVEAKLREGRKSDRPQLDKYSDWLRRQEEAHKPFVFLVPEVLPELDRQVIPRRWADLCIELRLAAQRLCGQHKVLPATMVLAFVSAVEQNILGFAAARQPRGRSLEELLQNPRTIEHVKRFVAGGKR
jgi:hypothetical protein